MACPNKNRQRPRTVAFRLTDEEFMRLEQRVAVTGEVKGDYLRAIALEGEINIFVGKYKSDKLALGIRKLTRSMDDALKNEELEICSDIIGKGLVLLEELNKVLIMNDDENVIA